MVSVLEMFRRAQTGPVVSEKEFLIKTLLPRAEELAKEYGVTRDPEEIIPLDPGIGDAVFKAAMVFLEDRGLWCSDTSRVIRFTRREINEALRRMPSEMSFGEGAERITVRHREPGDKTPAINWLGGYGVGYSSPELFLLAHQSYAQEPIDALQNGTLTHMYGKRVRLGSPDEYYAAALGSRLLREAARRAGRPDMAISFDCQAMTEYAHAAIVSPGGARLTDHWTLYPTYPCSTVKLTSLNKVAFSSSYGNRVVASVGGGGVLYGYAGGVETTAIVAVADAIGNALLDDVWSTRVPSPLDVNGMINSKECLWHRNVTNLALNRNIHNVTRGGAGAMAGPCTEMCLYEQATTRIADEANGIGMIYSANAANSEHDHSTGLEARWVCEVGDAVTGIGLDDANELLKTLVPKYEDRLKNPPKGKRFQECYDLETLTPSKEYVELYARVKKELEDLGIAFK
jgi:methylamine--corrinoid protein Co-methyltransferase